MLDEAVRYFNWVDVLLVMISLKIIYTSLKNGVVIELFKLSGALFSLYVCLHYYTVVSDTLRKGMALKNLPLDFFDFLIFIALFTISYFSFVVLRAVFFRMVKMQTLPRLNMFGGLLLGMGRIIVLSSLIVYVLAISTIGYLEGSVKTSYFGRDIFQIGVNTYGWLWNTFASKFMLDEKFNKTVLDIQKAFLRI
jgi:uncharacterized membrane protein required for colicin V production